MPRIFISYRRSDSGMFTGRIHDQLKASFGANNVFRDMYNIPAGSDFRSVLNSAIASTDVCLVIIGPKWLTVADAQGKRRLDDPNDFVRIEVELALKNRKTRVIPVLVDNAVMPVAEHLPASLAELAYRNAVQVRTDPDFPRDMEHLIRQLDRSEGRRVARSLWLVPLLLLLLISGFFLSKNGFGASFFPSMLRSPEAATATTRPPDTSTALLLPSETATLISPTVAPTMEPAAAGETRVLVAQMKQVGAQKRDVTDSIYNDLVSRFGRNPLFANVHILEYPGVVESLSQAGEVAGQWESALVLWGEYDDNGSTIHLQLGTLPALPKLEYDQNALDRMVSIDLNLKDEHRETVIYPVLSAIGFVSNAENDYLGTMRVIMALNQLNGDATIQRLEFRDNSSIAAHAYRTTWVFLSDRDTALSEINQAIGMDPKNPYLYTFRSVIHQGQGDFLSSNVDSETALGYAPHGWIMPYYIEGNESLITDKLQDGERAYTNIITAQPELWLPYNQRGYLYFFEHRYDEAQADIDRSQNLGPEAEWPYVWSTLIALRQGRLVDAREAMSNIKVSANPDFIRSLMSAMYGEEKAELLGKSMAAIELLSMKQYPTAALAASDVIRNNPTYAEMYLIKGVSYCNIEENQQAEEAYSAGLSVDPTFTVLYFLRAEVRSKLGDATGAAEDMSVVAQSDISANLKQYIEAAQAGQFSCKDITANP